MAVQQREPTGQRDLYSRPLFVCVLVGLLLIALRTLSPVLVPVLQAGFLTLLAAKPVLWLRRRRLPHFLAVFSVVVALTSILVALSTLVASSIAELTRRAPIYEQQLDVLIRAWTRRLESWNVEVSVGSIEHLLDPGSLVGYAAVAAQRVGVTFAQLVFVMLLVLFALLELPRHFPKFQALSSRATLDLDRAKLVVGGIDRYVLIKTWIGLGTGATAGILIAIIGVDHALLWGFLTFLLNYVPNVGSIIAAGPPILLAFLEMGPWPALLVAVTYLVVNLGFANILEPRVMGEGLGMSPVTILVSLLLWGWVFGPTGVLLAVPIGIALRSSLERSEETRWIAILLGLRRLEPPRPQPSDGPLEESAVPTRTK